jgi:hypothetical protein
MDVEKIKLTNKACRSEYHGPVLVFLLTSKCIPVLIRWKCYKRQLFS